MKKFIVPVIAISALMFIARPPQAPNTYAEVNMEEELVLTDDVQVMNIVEMIEYFEGDLVEEVSKYEYIEENLWIRDVDLDMELQEYLWQICEEYGVSYDLMLGLMFVESSFRHDVISETRDYGLTQINKINHERLKDELNINDFLNPKENMLAGVHMISELNKKYGDFDMVLMSYNMGERKARELVNRGITSSRYSRKVYEYKVKLETEGGI